MVMNRLLYGTAKPYEARSISFQYITTPVLIAEVSANTATITRYFNNQLNHYLHFCRMQQEVLTYRTQRYMSEVYKSTARPTATMLRDKNTWPSVKNLVVREELMKLQLVGKCDLPLTDAEKHELLMLLKDKDLAQLDEVTVKEAIERIISVDERSYLDALIHFKNTGEASHLLQQGKLPRLKAVLNDTDLGNITRDKFKYLLENFCERVEFDHGIPISKDATQQSKTDNVRPLKTSDHDKMHTDPKTGKVDYRQHIDEEPLNRAREMTDGNRMRVLSNELKGLTIAALIGLGIGFTMNLVAEMAIAGIASDKIGDIVFHSMGVGAESAMVSGMTYIAGRGITAVMEKVGLDIASKVGFMINTAAAGILSIAIICTYQYVKARLEGSDAGTALGIVRRTALSSLSLLAVSLIAQGVWGGHAGILVSTAVGLLYFSWNTLQNVHAQKLENAIREYAIVEYRNLLKAA